MKKNKAFQRLLFRGSLYWEVTEISITKDTQRCAQKQMNALHSLHSLNTTVMKRETGITLN